MEPVIAVESLHEFLVRLRQRVETGVDHELADGYRSIAEYAALPEPVLTDDVVATGRLILIGLVDNLAVGKSATDLQLEMCRAAASSLPAPSSHARCFSVIYSGSSLPIPRPVSV
ncbi:hypothetical protein R4P64_33120 [Rhodococcus sp. IEGM 1366]|uniref:hypothetical protein n=1 Tax=Rhodococcus sp. IEGM 1366 TaxID=3082223 RepID=UPI002955C150|nr:hypothetical protein [Rhodococcus sp. IEGM 1366]MDV8071355.1 hypothetical protein [Rhodococcus sp. IEGM 1366]